MEGEREGREVIWKGFSRIWMHGGPSCIYGRRGPNTTCKVSGPRQASTTREVYAYGRGRQHG